MLVLTRKEGERILIGEEIEVVVLGVRGDRVRLGIVAPHEVAVHRDEVRQRILQETAVKRGTEASIELNTIACASSP